MCEREGERVCVRIFSLSWMVVNSLSLKCVCVCVCVCVCERERERERESTSHGTEFQGVCF